MPAANTKKTNRQDGFTLVELLIAIFITGVISVAIYSMYNTFYRQAGVLDQWGVAQQNARVALNLMERELVNAGYAADTTHIITEATGGSIQFIYSDPNTTASRLKVRYGTQTSGGVKKLVRTFENLTTGTTPQTDEVIEYVETLEFIYYDIDGNVVDPTDTEAARDTIKFVTIRLVTRTKDNVPGTAAPGTFMLDTHIRLRNIGVGQASNDSTPPSSPMEVQVRDPGICNRLKVKFTKSPEGDVAGYKVYYGVSSGAYEGVVTVPLTVMTGTNYSCTDAGTSIECTIVPTSNVTHGDGTVSQVQALAYSPSDGSSTTMYYVAVKSYDNSLNTSSFSSEVSGNPSPSNSVFDSGTDDSTLNPVKPTAVTGLIAEDGPSDGQVALSWNPYATSSNPDVVGFRVYRSASPFTSYPIDPNAAAIDWVAGEPGSGKPELSQTATSYTDSGSLVGCRTYYYAIAPVKCDATLIPDDTGSDPNSKKYVQTDYAATCGDGTSACSAGTGFASVTGSDTAPDKTTAPNAPTIDARAGWKRVALSLTQPIDTDLSQTCVYVNDSSTYPDLLTDTATYPKVAGCLQVSLSSTPTAQLVPDSGGIFTSAELAAAGSTSFWHDSMALESPPEPSLAEVGTYSYRAISFDLCGNGSAVSAAQATTILCGEDPPSGEKPPAVTNAAVSCCSTPVTLSWTQVSSDTSMVSSINNPYDLAGYRVFRSTSADFSASVMVSGAAPFWGTTFNDTSATEGGTYYYRIVSTDCPYERTNPSEGTIRSNMISGFLNSVMVGPVRPGRIDRDEKCPGAGNCTKDDHRAILTGIDLDNTAGNGTGASTPDADYTHHKVTMFVHNTSSGTMTVTGVSVNWVNSAANLVDVRIGGGRSGVGTISTSINPSLTLSVSGNPPYTRGVSSVSLAPVTIPAGARYVPVRFKFLDASDNEVDMRDDQLLVTLNVTNDSTGTASCVSYMTVSGVQEAVYVPFGPSVTATQQNQPSSPTFGYAVPGVTGNNQVPSGTNGTIVVDPGLTVTVSANIAGNTTDETTGGKVAVSTATLYYRATAKTTTTAPTSGYTAVAMTNTAGNTWTANIPDLSGQRVWYYIVAVDNDGNWDRDPEIDNGSYVYDQKDFNICDVTPSAPASLSAVPSGGTAAQLSWNSVTTYTNGNSLSGSDSIMYRIYRGATQIGTDQAGTSYTDSGLASGVYSYTVKAINACASPGPIVSAASNTATTCVGTNSQALLTVSPTSIYRGGSYTVNIVDCLAMRSDAPYTYGTTIETINTTAGFTGFSNTSGATGYTYNPTIPETGVATGTFTKTITTTSDVTETATKLYVGASDTISVYYPYSSPNTRTVSVVVNPCTNTPKAPTGLTGSVSGQNMTLSWSAVTQNTDNSAITDLAGYRVYEKVCAKNKPNCTGADIVADWFLRTSVGSGTTSVTVGEDQGQLSQRIYYFKVSAYDSCGTPIEGAQSATWNE